MSDTFTEKISIKIRNAGRHHRLIGALLDQSGETQPEALARNLCVVVGDTQFQILSSPRRTGPAAFWCSHSIDIGGGLDTPGYGMPPRNSSTGAGRGPDVILSSACPIKAKASTQSSYLPAGNAKS